MNRVTMVSLSITGSEFAGGVRGGGTRQCGYEPGFQPHCRVPPP
jgi:hypothetical protein